jgi:hypothetical protein
MAKFEKKLTGNFTSFLSRLEKDLVEGSMTISLEDSSDVTFDQVRVAVRVYERYSAIGGNRVSLSITLVGYGENLFLSAITAGGSQAMFFKVNTIGEETFLSQVEASFKRYLSERQ